MSVKEFFRAIENVEFYDDKKPNKKTIKSIQEAKEGKVIRAKNVKELMKKLDS